MDCGTSNTCSGDPEILATHELAEQSVTRDECEFPQPAELQFCTQMDAQGGILNIPTSPLADALLSALKTEAGIDQAVPMVVTVDLFLVTPFVGGVTGHDHIVIDQKLLDILYELSGYLGMTAFGETTDALEVAMNNLVAYHEGSPGQNLSPGIYYPQSPDAQAAAADYFADLAGAIVYHEFGHYWAWACIDKVRANLGGGGGLFFWPSKLEDDADLIAGVLSAKAGHGMLLAQMAIDVMAFHAMFRGGQTYDFADVESAYAQYMQSTPQYSPLATRKALVQRGYEDWQSYGM